MPIYYSYLHFKQIKISLDTSMTGTTDFSEIPLNGEFRGGGIMFSVKTNMAAINANRQFGITTKGNAKRSEKLSSGYRINRAADDAAGLSISEKMRRQVRGLTQAAENAQDGVSMLQVGEAPGIKRIQQ